MSSHVDSVALTHTQSRGMPTGHRLSLVKNKLWIRESHAPSIYFRHDKGVKNVKKPKKTNLHNSETEM